MTLPIDLRSDTVTKPTDDMRRAIMAADVGDDAYFEDPSHAKLQSYCQDLFQMEACLLVTSGMLGNRLALLSQVERGQEVILERRSHIHVFDSSPTTAVCGAVLHPVDSPQGYLRVLDVHTAIHSKQRHSLFAVPQLISIENTLSGCGGSIFPFEEMIALKDYAQSHNLKLHLDGARLFNAHVETKIPLADYARQVDTLTVCFSKGLGAPFGSLLMGSREVINRATKYKVWLGSGYHQIGFMAEACHYALTHHIPFLKQDHHHAKLFYEGLHDLKDIHPPPTAPETNIIHFRLPKDLSPPLFLVLCREQGLLLFPWMGGVIRAVTHRGISTDDIFQSLTIIRQVLYQMTRGRGL